MKNLLKVMITLCFIIQGAASAEQWSSHQPSSPDFKGQDRGWNVSTRPSFRPFEPISLPRIVVVPVIRIHNPSVYYQQSYEHYQRHYRHLERRHLDRRFYR